MDLIIREELRAYIDPLTPDEYEALEQSILADGCRDPLILWGDVLVDGHNRYAICSKHNLPFNVVRNAKFRSIDDVYLWMIDNHLGRRSVSDYQRGVLALRKREILAVRAQPAQVVAAEEQAETETAPAAVAPVMQWNREEAARLARLSSATLGKIDKIQKDAAPALVEAVRAGMISISAAADVASLPEDKQLVAVAGGKQELREAARQVREARLPPKPKMEEPPEDATPEQREIHRLNYLLAEMTEERNQLKKKVQHLTIALKEARGE